MANGRLVRFLAKNILQLFWKFMLVVILISTIVLSSINASHAFYLRQWRNETIDTVPVISTFNTSIYQKFQTYLNSKFNISDGLSSDNKPIVRIFGVSATNIHSEKKPRKCKPEPPRDNFSKCGNRVAERKCCEYMWTLKYKTDLLERLYCLSDIFEIIGGTHVEEGDFPHMVALGFKVVNETYYAKYKKKYMYKCGGSLISEQFVLTAAHCTHVGSSNEHELIPSIVSLGSETLSENEMKTFSIDKIIKHKKYMPPKKYYDIALLKLLTKVVFTHAIHPACLSTELFPEHTKVNITGWGVNRFGDKNMSNYLLVASVYIVHPDKCNDKRLLSRHFKQVRTHNICAGVTAGGVDSCQGDSGGPLQTKINTEYGNIHRIIGVTNFGRGCGSKIPSVYMKVSSVISWIEKIVWPEYKRGYYEGFKPGKL